MRRRSVVLYAAGLSVLAMASVGVTFANAASLPLVDSQLVAPLVHQGGNSFYTDAQVDAVWAAVTSHYPRALPDGVAFPAKAPPFFHPNDGQSHLFQTALPDEIAARMWRCAWLASSISAVAENRKTDAAKAKTTLAGYATLPSMAGLVDVPGYQGQINAYAKRIGVDPSKAEFNLECSTYQQDMVTK